MASNRYRVAQCKVAQAAHLAVARAVAATREGSARFLLSGLNSPKRFRSGRTPHRNPRTDTHTRSALWRADRWKVSEPRARAAGPLELELHTNDRGLAGQATLNVGAAARALRSSSCRIAADAVFSSQGNASAHP